MTHSPFSIHLCAICDIIPFVFGNTTYRRGIFYHCKKTTLFCVRMLHIFIIFAENTTS